MQEGPVRDTLLSGTDLFRPLSPASPTPASPTPAPQGAQPAVSRSAALRAVISSRQVTPPRDPAAPPLLAPATGPRQQGSPVPTQLALLARRCLRTARTDRGLRGLVAPMLLLVLFSQVFAGLGDLPGVAAFGGYTAFLVPATLVTLALTAAVGTGGGLAADVAGGLLDRVHMLPVAPFAVLAARSVAGTVLLAAHLVVVLVAAVAGLGFRPAGGPLGVLGALLVATVVGCALGWVALALVAVGRVHRAGIGTLLVLVLFGSSAYVPLASMPGWVQVLASANPLTHAVDAVRGLALGQPNAAGPVLAGSVAVAVVAAAVATRSLHRTTL